MNSVLTLFDAAHNVVAQNDDYYSNDSYLDLQLEAGTYYVGVTSTGNTRYDPDVLTAVLAAPPAATTELHMNFIADPRAVLVDQDTTAGTALDGDADGQAGGVFDFWFRTAAPVVAPSAAAETIFVDKSHATTPVPTADTGESLQQHR